jgi:hypothetical protein
MANAHGEGATILSDASLSRPPLSSQLRLRRMISGPFGESSEDFDHMLFGGKEAYFSAHSPDRT